MHYVQNNKLQQISSLFQYNSKLFKFAILSALIYWNPLTVNESQNCLRNGMTSCMFLFTKTLLKATNKYKNKYYVFMV